MNRRNFIKTAAAGAVAPSALGNINVDIAEASAGIDQYYITRYTIRKKPPRTSTWRPYGSIEALDENYSGSLNVRSLSIEDAVQFIFEDYKSFDLKEIDVIYDIYWWNGKEAPLNKARRPIQVGHYQFKEHSTYSLHLPKNYTGWHAQPPHTDYCAVEFA